METENALAPLKGQEAYTCYFKQLRYVIEKLCEFFTIRAERKDGRHYESVVISDFLSRLLYTTEALKKKYVYHPRRTMKIDLGGSGFPSFFDFSYLTTDLQRKGIRLEDLPATQSLKQEILDFMFKYKEEPEKLLWRLSERSYYEMLDPDKIFFAFTPAPSIRVNKKSENFRSYTFSWGCYDFATNRPYIHIMIFDQSAKSVPLENRDANYQEFLEMIHAEGSRASSIGVLALGLDSNLKDIHPKVIKRIGIGPICTKRFSKVPEELFRLLNQNGENEDDFILLFEEEIILSSRQEVSRSVFSFGQARETFYIPETDIECYERKASKIYKHILLPHTVLQHADMSGSFREYRNHEIITFTKGGGIHVN